MFVCDFTMGIDRVIVGHFSVLRIDTDGKVVGIKFGIIKIMEHDIHPVGIVGKKNGRILNGIRAREIIVGKDNVFGETVKESIKEVARFTVTINGEVYIVMFETLCRGVSIAEGITFSHAAPAEDVVGTGRNRERNLIPGNGEGIALFGEMINFLTGIMVKHLHIH